MGKHLMQLIVHSFRLQIHFFAQLASVFVNSMLAYPQYFGHLGIGKIGT